MVESFSAILTTVLEAPSTKLDAIAGVPESQFQKLLLEFQGELHPEYAAEEPLISQFEAIAARTSKDGDVIGDLPTAATRCIKFDGWLMEGQHFTEKGLV